jgi:hypothetical protein
VVIVVVLFMFVFVLLLVVVVNGGKGGGKGQVSRLWSVVCFWGHAWASESVGRSVRCMGTWGAR